MSETSRVSGMCGSALGMVIVSDLRVEARGAEDAGGAGGLGKREEVGSGGSRPRDLRRGKVGSSCGLGPAGMAGRGLLIRLRPADRVAFELKSRGGRGMESRRAGDVLKGSRGEDGEITWLNSRMYHDRSSSSCSSWASSVLGSGVNGASVNSKISTGFASGSERDGAEWVAASGWNDI
jgi:hypothetical protein